MSFPYRFRFSSFLSLSLIVPFFLLLSPPSFLLSFPPWGQQLEQVWDLRQEAHPPMQFQETQGRRQGYELCVFVDEGGIWMEWSKGGELRLCPESGISRASKPYWDYPYLIWCQQVGEAKVILFCLWAVPALPTWAQVEERPPNERLANGFQPTRQELP